MKKRLVDRRRSIPTYDQAAEVPELGKRAFDFPATLVTSKGRAVLRGWPNATALMRSNQLDPTPPQRATQRVAVIGLVCDQPLRLLPRPTGSRAPRDPDRSERLFDQRDFGRGRRVQVVSQRKT